MERSQRLSLSRFVVVLMLVFGALRAFGSQASKTEFERFYAKWANKPIGQLKDMGVKYLNEGDLDKGLLFLNMAIKRYDGDAPVEQQHDFMIAYINAGAIYSIYSDSQQSYNNLMHAYEICNKFGFQKRFFAYIYTNLGNTYESIGYYDKAMKLHRRAFTYAINNKDLAYSIGGGDQYFQLCRRARAGGKICRHNQQAGTYRHT